MVTGGGEVVRDHHDGGLLVTLVGLEQVIQVVLSEEVDAGGRLIEDHEAWRADERAREVGALQLSAREAGEGTVTQARGPNALQGLTCGVPLPSGTASGPRVPQSGNDEFEGGCGEAAVERLELRNVAQVGGGRAGRAAEDVHLARTRCDESEENLDERGLSGTVGSDDREKAVFRKREGDVLQNVDVSEPYGEVAHGDGIRRRGIERRYSSPARCGAGCWLGFVDGGCHGRVGVRVAAITSAL